MYTVVYCSVLLCLSVKAKIVVTVDKYFIIVKNEMIGLHICGYHTKHCNYWAATDH